MERQELREMFEHFDADNNGIIDMTEFTALLNALDADMEEDEIAIGFDTIDTDGNGTIEFAEFMTWWTAK